MTGWKYQLSRFLLTGSVSTAVNYGVFFAMAYGLHIHYIVASMVGYMTGLGVGYVLNRNWTFSTHKAMTKLHNELGLYIGVNVTSLILSLLLLQILVDWVGLPAWFSNIMAIGLSTTTNFIGLKFIVFKHEAPATN
ncbi:MAG: GtrA family protein [uncultured bacterium]|nr:MAG: GtrA family protein [uncultured bacterium]